MRTRDEIATAIARICNCGTFAQAEIHDRVLDGIAEFVAAEDRAAWRAYAAAALTGIRTHGLGDSTRFAATDADALLAAERARFDAPTGGKP